MPTVQLTDRKIQSLMADAPQVDFWDQSLPCFGLRVSQHGRKSFIVMYRSQAGKRRMTLGTYPVMGLAEARQRAKEVLHRALLGEDPQREKIALRKAERFEELAADYLEHYAKPRKKRWTEDERIIESDLLPAWKGRPIKEIGRRDVVLLLDGIVKRGSPIMANRTRALISKIFNFGIGRDLAQHNPCLGVPQPGKERQRERVLTESEIRRLWKVLDSEALITAATFRMRLITAQRGIEVLTMRWEDIDGDWWTQPASVTKNSLTHRVPLTSQAKRLLAQLRPYTGASPWVFSSPRKPGSPILSVRKAAGRIAKKAGIDFVPHDLRRTAASFMTSMGVSRLVVAKILNHVESGITAVYDRHSYDTEKREALTIWGNRLEKILSES